VLDGDADSSPPSCQQTASLRSLTNALQVSKDKTHRGDIARARKGVGHRAAGTRPHALVPGSSRRRPDTARARRHSRSGDRPAPARISKARTIGASLPSPSKGGLGRRSEDGRVRATPQQQPQLTPPGRDAASTVSSDCACAAAHEPAEAGPGSRTSSGSPAGGARQEERRGGASGRGGACSRRACAHNIAYQPETPDWTEILVCSDSGPSTTWEPSPTSLCHPPLSSNVTSNMH
jgi:hypothetical protein